MKTLKPIAEPFLSLPYVNSLGKIGVTTKRSINSELSSTELCYQIRKNLPPPNILGTFYGILDALQPKYDEETELAKPKGKAIFLVGERGCGKTSAAKLAMYLVDGENPETFECGNRSLDDLLVETVFDDSTSSLLEIIQDRYNGISLPKLDDFSISMIEKNFKEAIISQEEEGKSRTIIKKKILDFNKVQNHESKLDIIKKIKEDAKLDKQEGGIGIKYVEGPLLKACKNGKKIIIDEVDKAIEGTGTSLQSFWLALAGEAPYHFKKSGIEFLFSADNIHPNFGVVLTANDLRDGELSSGISESLRDRLSIVAAKDSNAESIAVRIGQILLGFNYTTLEAINADQTTTAEIFENIRKEGGGSNMNKQEKILFKNWNKTVKACKQLGDFFYDFNIAMQPGNTKIQDDLLEAQRNISLTPVGPRFVIDIIKKAMSYVEYVQPDAVVPTSYSEIKAAREKAEKEGLTENIEIKMGLGEKFEIALIKAIEDFAGGEPTKKFIFELAKFHRVLPGHSEENNMKFAGDTIRELLNTLETEIAIEPQTIILQKELAEQLKIENPELKNVENEKIVPIAELQLTINKTIKQTSLNKSPGVSYIIGANPEYAKSINESPIRLIPIIDIQNTKKMEELEMMEQVFNRDGTPHMITTLKYPQDSNGEIISSDPSQAVEKQEQLIRIRPDVARVLMLDTELINILKHDNIRKNLLENLMEITDNYTEIKEGEELEVEPKQKEKIAISRILCKDQNGKGTRIILFNAVIKGENKTWIFAKNSKVPQTGFEGKTAQLITNSEIMEKILKDNFSEEEIINDLEKLTNIGEIPKTLKEAINRASTSGTSYSKFAAKLDDKRMNNKIKGAMEM